MLNGQPKAYLMNAMQDFSSLDVAKIADVDPRYLKELLSANAANGYVNYDSETACFYMTPEQAAVFATEESPAGAVVPM